jgi:predicted dinucleotide-binding enzyme
MLPGARLVRAFNAIGSASLTRAAERPGAPLGVPIAGDDPEAIALASSLIRELGLEPVLVGGLQMGKYLVPGTPLGGEHNPDEIRRIAATLK